MGGRDTHMVSSRSYTALTMLDLGKGCRSRPGQRLNPPSPKTFPYTPPINVVYYESTSARPSMVADLESPATPKAGVSGSWCSIAPVSSPITSKSWSAYAI